MAQKILVIEDDKDIRDTMAFALQQANYEVITSGDAKILTSILNVNPNLILLDNWLTDWKSDANGEQLSKQLKSDPTTNHIPIVIVSAVSNVKEIAEAGLADGYLKKPFDVDKLINTVKRYAK
jgi:DNA-binding response OmpR family regulator